jgi:threonine dehydratase
MDLTRLKAETEQAAERLGGWVQCTPLIRRDWLDRLTGGRVYLKLEIKQPTGSCKIRSAGNLMLSNLEEARSRGIVTASTGNNAIAHGYLCRRLKVRGVGFLPYMTDGEKARVVEEAGLEVHFHGADIVESETEARRYATETGAIYHSPYNDEKVIAGQATIAKEIVEQLPRADFILVTVGGGGLAAGISGYLRAVEYPGQVVGCLPAASPTMAKSIAAGRIVQTVQLPSISDSAGGIEEDSVTFDYCAALLRKPAILVSEDEIKRAMSIMDRQEGIQLEGAGAIPLAALLQQRNLFEGRVVVLCLCGSNIGRRLFSECIADFFVPDKLQTEQSLIVTAK